MAHDLRTLKRAELEQIVFTDLTNARNPSAVVSSRIQTVRAWETQRGAAEVQEYLARHRVDDTAAQALRALPIELQKEVVRSDLSSARNPSAVLLSRVRALETQAGPPMVAPQPAAFSAPGMTFGGAFAMPPVALLAQPPPPSTRPPPRHLAGPVEEYIHRHQLDDRVAQELRALLPTEQQQIITSSITNARNPSAIVSSRIQAVRSQSTSLTAVDVYIAKHMIDETAARELRQLPGELQLQVTGADLSNCRNPNAVLLSRIRSLAAPGTR